MGKMMQVRGPDDLRNSLDQIAKRKGFSRNALLLKILWEYVEKEKLKEKKTDSNYHQE